METGKIVPLKNIVFVSDFSGTVDFGSHTMDTAGYESMD